MTRSAYSHSRWPSPAPDPAAAALAELAQQIVVAGPGEWVLDGVCRDDDTHYPTGREDSPRYRMAAATAKRECAGCPVREQCLAYALEAEEDGIWGGTTPGERKAIRTQRDRDQRHAS